jgi:hypothetical protein
MTDRSVVERLKGIMEKEMNNANLTSQQKSTILALIDEINQGGTITDEYLLRVFDQIGGGA